MTSVSRALMAVLQCCVQPPITQLGDRTALWEAREEDPLLRERSLHLEPYSAVSEPAPHPSHRHRGGQVRLSDLGPDLWSGRTSAIFPTSGNILQLDSNETFTPCKSVGSTTAHSNRLNSYPISDSTGLVSAPYA